MNQLTSMSEINASQALRALMPALSNKAYFNYGGQGPLPKPSLDAITKSWEKIQDLGPFTNKVWPYLISETESTRKLLAKLCGVSSERLALTENVTSGCVLPIWGLPFSEGDRILISDCEHPGVIAACRELALRKKLGFDILHVQKIRQGANEEKVRNSNITAELEKSLKAKTRLLVLSHLLWNTGQIMPISLIGEILAAHPNRPFLLVDAAQSFGQIPIQEDVQAADIYAFTGHKWACGPEGLGGVSLSERLLAEASPTLVGWRSLKHENSVDVNQTEPFYKDSRRFEIATSCIPLLAGLRCSLELLEKYGTLAKRHKKIRESSAQLWASLQKMEGVTPLLSGAPPAGLVSFAIPGGPSTREVVKTLGKQNLWIRDLEDPLCLRACLHITSEEDEVNKLIVALSRIS